MLLFIRIFVSTLGFVFNNNPLKRNVMVRYIRFLPSCPLDTEPEKMA